MKIKVLFLPYKASMWDSLESIWCAAKSDSSCDVSVVPIPYYEKNSDGSKGQIFYDGALFPKEVEITSYQSYDMASEKPDVIYIHNPYDNANNATTVDEKYYSKELKKYTKKLVYVPYYVTAGNTSEAQELLPAYIHSDYIVLQSEDTKGFIDERIADDKLLTFGSPKIDRIVKVCSEKNSIIPDEWKASINGRKVFFYNTSLGGMLAATGAFLAKMSYVFQCFSEYSEACLLWRPHPLLESSFHSMREEWFPIYNKLKQYFIDNNLGIYDDTPDIETAIAVADAYIGDAMTSVTALFGAAGKQLFILDNKIDAKPASDDWKGMVTFLHGYPQLSRWMLFRNNLLESSDRNYCFDKRIELNTHNNGGYYIGVIERGRKTYVLPGGAQDVIVIENGQVREKLELKKCSPKMSQFYSHISIGKYILLLPCNYPYFVRIDTEKDNIDYLPSKELKGFLRQFIDGEQYFAAAAVWQEYVIMASPSDDTLYALNSETMEIIKINLGIEDYLGAIGISTRNEELWLIPRRGDEIVKFLPSSGEVVRYKGMPDGFSCHYNMTGAVCDENPFNSISFYGEYCYLSPWWGNMFVRLNIETGDIKKWNPPFKIPQKDKNCYYKVWAPGSFICNTEDGIGLNTRYFSLRDRRLYAVDFSEDKAYEVSIEIDENIVRECIKGFAVDSKWLGYVCVEDAYNTLSGFINNEIIGNVYNRKEQLLDFEKRVNNPDGSCGRKIHEYVISRLK